MRDNALVGLRIQEVLHGEVGKLQTQLTDDTGLTPTGRELDLVVGLGGQVILNVHRSVFRIRYGHRIHVFRVEVSHLGQFTYGTHQGVTAEELARFRTQLTTDNVFIQAVVTVDDDPVDRCLRTLLDTDLQGDRVARHIRLDRIGTEEEVTVIIIDIGHSIIVGLQTLLQFLLVIDITALHAQYGLQVFRRILRVTHETDILQIIFLPLFDRQVNIHLLLVVVDHTVCQQDSIPITELVVFRDDVLLIILILFGRELFRTEHFQQTGLPVVVETELFVGLLHRLFQGTVTQLLVTVEIDAVDLGLFVLVDVDVQNHLALVSQVILLNQIDLHILEALCIEELLDDQFGTVQHIGCNLEALLQAQLLLQVFPFPLLDAMIIHLRNTRTLLQLDLQPNRIVLDLIGHDLHIGKEAMLPEAFDRCRDLVTRYRDFVTYRQTGESYQHKIIIILHTRHLNVRNLVFAG